MNISFSIRSLMLLAPMAAVWSEATPILPSLRGLRPVSTNIWSIWVLDRLFSTYLVAHEISITVHNIPKITTWHDTTHHTTPHLDTAQHDKPIPTIPNHYKTTTRQNVTEGQGYKNHRRKQSGGSKSIPILCFDEWGWSLRGHPDL